MREILSNYINIAPQAIVFQYGQQGKPLIAEAETGIEFNLTTSGDLALLAVGAEEPVGVDCEQVRERRDLVALAKRMFTPNEASRIAAAKPDDRLELFHLAWTALESRVKADGWGLAHRREFAAQDTLNIGHFIPERGFLAAVARQSLPPVAEWMTLELAAG